LESRPTKLIKQLSRWLQYFEIARTKPGLESVLPLVPDLLEDEAQREKSLSRRGGALRPDALESIGYFLGVELLWQPRKLPRPNNGTIVA
jgi:hypothetical protein